MKNLRRTILSVLTILTMVLFLVPVEPVRAEDGGTGDYVLLVGGVQVTDENKDDILNDGGKAKFDPATGTLTLDGPTLSGDVESGIYAENLDLIINGNVRAIGTKYGIRVKNGNLTIEGGDIYAGGETAIRSNQNILINGGNVEANAKGGSEAYGIFAEKNLTIKDGTVTVTSKTNAGVLENAYGLYAGLEIEWDGSSGTVEISGGTVTVNVVDGYHSYAVYGNTVISGGETMLESNSNNYYADGITDGSFTMSDGKLQIKVKADEYGSGIQDSWEKPITITGGELIVESEGKNTEYGCDAIGTQGDITISGGKITAKGKGGQGSNGISQWLYSGSHKFEISGGEINASGEGNDGTGIYTNQNLTISGGTLECTGTDIGIATDETNLTIGNGINSVAAKGGESGIYTLGTLSLGNELTIKKPTNGKVSSDGKTIVDSSNKNSKDVLIVNENPCTIKINETEHGKVTSSRTKANPGDTIELTAVPDESCHLESINVEDANGEYVLLILTETGYKFYMPESDVTVYAEFDYNWGEPSYEWAEDNSKVTAKRVCTDNDGIVEEETVEATSEIIKAATCTEAGEAKYTSAEFENEAFTLQEKTVEIPATGHNWGSWKVTKKAKAAVKGEKQRVCKNDPSHIQKKTIPATGVSGTLLSKITAKGKTSLVLTWNKIKNAEGYDIFFTDCGKKTPKKVKTIKGNKTFKWTKKGLKKNTAYKARVKAWVKKNGKKTYVRTSLMVHAFTSGGTKVYTNSKSVTVTKTKVSLKVGKTYKIKGNVVKLDKKKKLMMKDHEVKLRYVTSNKKIATVSKSGKITAKAKGSCIIYVIAVNGARKAITVTIK